MDRYPQTADGLPAALQELPKSLGKTIIMVTHDPHAAERAQRIVRLEKGKLVEDAFVTSKKGDLISVI